MLITRPANPEDAQAISQLMQQLGYEISPELMQSKIEFMTMSEMDAVFVAEITDQIVGVISIHALELFHACGKLGRITSLVVDKNMRQQGVGKLLFSTTESFFRAQNCVRIEVTSSDHRTDAHAFYQSLGFKIDQRRFIK
ncbi:GNAT family N-acetyltransferase [Chitinibacter sp. FCG-7]|uniref:GNAT family N-acetyltransferase n=1 Tax=Chitinibacter mangrovi TaxID=3153927 RepID=A0AAU7FA64_9NEIS